MDLDCGNCIWLRLRVSPSGKEKQTVRGWIVWSRYSLGVLTLYGLSGRFHEHGGGCRVQWGVCVSVVRFSLGDVLKVNENQTKGSSSGSSPSLRLTWIFPWLSSCFGPSACCCIWLWLRPWLCNPPCPLSTLEGPLDSPAAEEALLLKWPLGRALLLPPYESKNRYKANRNGN